MISIVAAVAFNGVIGKDNKLPWRLPADLKRFKQLTSGHPIVMGRKTFESIGKPLPDRVNVILSKNPEYKIDGCRTVNSIDQVLDLQSEFEDIKIIGGAYLYGLAMPYADRLQLTVVHAEPEGDVYFPSAPCEGWNIYKEPVCLADEKNQYNHTFVTLNKIRDNTETSDAFSSWLKSLVLE